MEKLELVFSREKETKNTIRYKEDLGEKAYSSRDIAAGMLYVQKGALPGGFGGSRASCFIS